MSCSNWGTGLSISMVISIAAAQVYHLCQWYNWPIADCKLRLTLADFLRSKLLRNLQRIGRRHLYIGLDSRALPVRLRDRIDEAPERHSHEEVVVDPMRRN